ncbi:MAG: hypothetical protein Q9208_004646 [Pyrenodesmia sp. 3 TL-2023]
MELRKSSSRKAPRRYEDELEEEHGQPSSVRVARHNAYRGKVIEYNPQLRPAVFPTLNPGTLPPENQQRPNANAAANQRKETQTPSTSFSSRDLPTSFLQQDSLQISPQAMPATLQQPDMSFGASNSLHTRDNGPGNPVWEKNMAQMALFGDRTEEDWNIAEMVSSDEDVEPTRKTQKAPTVTAPPWESIPLVLQIDMAYEAFGDDSRPENGLLRLRLNSAQRDTMMDELLLFQERERVENANIAAHQAATSEALLSLDKRNGTQEAFRSRLPEHLYKDIDRPDTMATRRQVNDARAYMTYCGLNTAFLDGWAPPSTAPQTVTDAPYTVTESDDEIDAKYPHSVSLREALGAPPAIAEQSRPIASASMPREPSTGDGGEIQGSPTNGALSQSARQTPCGNNGVSNPSSASQYSAPIYNAPPQTPQGPLMQYPLLAQNPAPAPIPRSVPGPLTPPTPSMVTLPLPESSESDYEPQAKKKRPNIKKKQPVPPKQPLLASGNANQDSGPGTSSQALQDFAHGNTDHSSATPSQEGSTIMVQHPGEVSTSTGGGTALQSDGPTPPKKGKPSRGRGRPKKSAE